jgi:hypothetical protein
MELQTPLPSVLPYTTVTASSHTAPRLRESTTCFLYVKETETGYTPTGVHFVPVTRVALSVFEIGCTTSDQGLVLR